MRRLFLVFGLTLLCLVPVIGVMTDHSSALPNAVSTELPAMPRY